MPADGAPRGFRAGALAVAVVTACAANVSATPLEQGGGTSFGAGRTDHVAYESTDVRSDAAPEGAATTSGPVVATGASGALVINPTFDSSITGDANDSAIEAMINDAVAVYE